MNGENETRKNNSFLYHFQSLNHLELGRAMGTMLTDPGFKELAYRASSKEQLLNGIDQFLQSTSILPPAVWDPSIRLEPHGPVSRKRKMAIFINILFYFWGLRMNIMEEVKDMRRKQ
jgi:hypothetical protein